MIKNPYQNLETQYWNNVTIKVPYVFVKSCVAVGRVQVKLKFQKHDTVPMFLQEFRDAVFNGYVRNLCKKREKSSP